MDDLTWLESAPPSKTPRRRRVSAGDMTLGCLVIGACVALLLAAVAIVVIYTRPPAASDFQMRLLAHREIEARLKCPSTAQFGGSVITSLGTDRYRIAGIVDAQNGFGAMIRSTWSVEIRYHSENDSYETLSATVD